MARMYKGAGATTPGIESKPGKTGRMYTGYTKVPDAELIAAVGALYDAGESKAKIMRAFGMSRAKVETCISWYLMKKGR